MKSRNRRIRRLLLAVSCGGVTLFTGCLANLTGNLDLLLSSGAVGSAVRLPFSAVGGLAESIVRFTHLFSR